MQPLKKDIRSPVKPLQQLARRYMERRQLYEKMNYNKDIISNEKVNGDDDIQLISKIINEKGGPLTSTTKYPQYKGVKTAKFTLGINIQDNCVQMENKDIVVIESIATSKLNESEVVIIGRKYKTLSNVFQLLCAS